MSKPVAADVHNSLGMATVPGEYTLTSVLVAATVVLIEVLLVRAGIFREPRYWIALAIMVGFQIPVDGWLTKLAAPIVAYDPDAISGLRMPWNIPVEDFAFGFALVTVTLMIWSRATRGDDES